MEKLMSNLERDVEIIFKTQHSMNIKKYLEKRLPLYYPNKGLLYMVKRGTKIEVFHERFDLSSFLGKVKDQPMETIIDYYGSTHQRDYCYVVLGHRFQGVQKIQFRGILGKNRLYKILLMLRLSGISSEQIIVYNSYPDYKKIITQDFNSLVRPVDCIIIGGDVIIKPFLSSQCVPLVSNRGEIVSWTLFNYNQKQVLFTSYPYADLCEHVIEGLQFKIKETTTMCFVGSCGTLKKELSVGDVILPITVYDNSGSLVTHDFPNNWANCNGLKGRKHISVKTPLLETMNSIEDLTAQGYETIDTEIAYFQQGCERFLNEYNRVGIILFVSDNPNSSQPLSNHDYSLSHILNVRRHLAQILEEKIKNL